MCVCVCARGTNRPSRARKRERFLRCTRARARCVAGGSASPVCLCVGPTRSQSDRAVRSLSCAESDLQTARAHIRSGARTRNKLCVCACVRAKLVAPQLRAGNVSRGACSLALQHHFYYYSLRRVARSICTYVSTSSSRITCLPSNAHCLASEVARERNWACGQQTQSHAIACNTARTRFAIRARARATTRNRSDAYRARAATEKRLACRCGGCANAARQD